MIGPRCRTVASAAVAVVVSVVALAAVVLAPAVGVRAAPDLPAGATVPASMGTARQQPPVIVYRPPVDAPVSDPFRRPGHTYGAGNRGLTYDVAPGAIVRASAAGIVVFAGAIGVDRFVTIAHADGWTTTYSFLDGIGVAAGDPVAAGAPIASATTGFHFGVRDGPSHLDPAYLDPAGVFAVPSVAVRLVR